MSKKGAPWGQRSIGRTIGGHVDPVRSVVFSDGASTINLPLYRVMKPLGVDTLKYFVSLLRRNNRLFNYRAAGQIWPSKD